MAIISTPAIVLKTHDLRETSKIARFFTREKGKVAGVLKGIRKDPKKFRTNLDQATVNDIVYYESRKSELFLVSQCDLTEFFPGIRQDSLKLNAACYALELIDKIMAIEQPNFEIYDLLIRYLKSLETTLDVSALVYCFQIKILKYSGFKPHLDSCVITGQALEGRARFSMKMGGLVYDGYQSTQDDLVLVSAGAVRSILYIEKGDWSECLRLKLNAKIKAELKYVLNNFLVFHLERQIKSAKFL